MTRSLVPPRRGRSAWLVGAVLFALAGFGARADAQCAGDCDGGGTVSVNELVRGVNIALGLANLSTCPAFNTNGDATVSVSELVAAVRNALNACAGGNTPTATSTPASGSPTPTHTPQGGTPTFTPTIPAGCGNGTVDFNLGETCDDGNTAEGIGDSCPSDCRIATCQVSGQKAVVDVAFDTDPANLLITGLTLFIRYPDGTVDVPGVNNDPSVLAAVTSDFFSVTPNDTNFSLTAVLIDPFLSGVNAGNAIAINLEVCQGATAPPAGAFSCQVTDATDVDGAVVTDQVSCRVVPR